MLSNVFCRGSARTSAVTSAAFRRPLINTPKIRIMPSAVRSNSTAHGYVEDLSKGKMLRFQESLPKLPVPTLEETAARYLKSVEPITTPAEFAKTKAAVEEFVRPGGVGEALQKKLVAKREDPNVKNWMIDWWNFYAYLGYRDPVVPYVSYFYSYKDDKRYTSPAKRAAVISAAALEFRKDVVSGNLEPEYMRKAPICMDTYQYMFNCCRIPAQPADFAKKYDTNANKHIAVVRKNQFFKVLHEVDGVQLSAGELEAQFARVIELANDSTSSPAVGALTSENRDTWTSARETLLAASPNNAAALETIESASFVVCLDDTAPVTLEERAHQYWHGDGANRFYDKPLQFIVNENGTAGFIGEHSMMDGTPTLRINDYVCDLITNNKINFDFSSVRSHLPEPSRISFTANEDVTKAIDTAKANFRDVIGKHDLRVLQYLAYGKNLIKKFKCSPDAYVQMIIQLAYFKMYGKNRPTYESAATRKYQQGRTETCRSVSSDSVAFCKAMASPDATPAECIALLRKAVASHVEYITAAGEGKGVDRHLFGLKQCLEPGQETPAIFADPVCSYSSSWFLSTSQLNSEYFNGYGWSQVIDQGFGIAYMVNNDALQFNIVSKKLGADKMFFYLTEAANEMRALMETELEAPKAKL
ncbi:acyltransferase ChoActase/COT/CPT [Pyronema omphalodes]|nr:acyltransferase ChoActase/COT/CPT [Pyronema omphalodes]